MIKIIVQREQITPAWLTNTLMESGLQATVTDVEVEPIIAGYYGTSSRLTVTYLQDDDSLPRSLFLKMASEHESARTNAAEQGMYRYEVGFYKDLANQVNISTPRCYSAEISDDNSAFVLLLEDAAPFVQIDQVLGLSLEQGMLAMQELAGLHASTWQGKGMENCDWAKVTAEQTAAYADAMVQLTPMCLERFATELSNENAEILNTASKHAHAFWRYQLECKNLVATHCDFRGDNMLFGDKNGEPAIVVIDWVGMLCSSGRDLGHFLGTSLLSELRQEHEVDLLTHYHNTLVAQGVTDFTLQECIDDYRRNLMYPLFVVVTATASVDIDERGRRLFSSMINRTCDAIKQSNALELIQAL